MPSASVATPYLHVLLDGARAANVKVDDLLADERVRDTLANPEGRLERQLAHYLWEEIARRSGDESFGLHLAERIKPGAFAVLDYVVRNAPTLGEAYARIERYSRLIHNGSEVRLDRNVARLSYTLPAVPGGSPRHAAEFIVATWLVTARQMIEVEFRPQRVRFQHPRPLDTTEHRRLFDCPLEFGAETNELAFSSELLEQPLRQADPRLGLLLDRYAKELLAKLPKSEDFPSTVRRLVAEALRGGDPSLETIAKRLRMSPRTLQRRLREDGASHQELLDEMRRTLAHKYLSEPSVAIGEAAFLLGFSEPSAFHRAFKRWTGTTPGEYRRRAMMQ